MRVRSLIFVVVLASAFFLPLVQADVLTVPVTLSVGTADVAVHVIENGDRHPKGLDVLIVHGLAQTGATFGPLANALFDERMGRKVGRVYVADLPGHGASAMNPDSVFGFLLLQDYAAAVIAVMDEVEPDIVIGHSMGAAVVQVAQQALVDAGTNLRDRFGVRGAVLIAPVIPPGRPWGFVDSGAVLAILGVPTLVNESSARGPILTFEFLADFWSFLFHSDRAGAVPAGAPTGLQAVANGYIADEAYFASLQTIRLIPYIVDEGIFAASNGTATGVVNNGQDWLFTASEHENLYRSLTGDAQSRLFFVVDDPEAVHNAHTFRPDLLLQPIKRVINAIDRVE